MAFGDLNPGQASAAPLGREIRSPGFSFAADASTMAYDGGAVVAGSVQASARLRERSRGVRVGRGNRRRANRFANYTWWGVARALIELISIATVAMVLVVASMGYVADQLRGAGLWSHLLPFAGVVLVVGLVCAAGLWGWVVLRRWLDGWATPLPMTVAAGAAIAAIVFARAPTFQEGVGDLGALIGGSEEAERQTIAHQVYAQYRRTSVNDLRKMLERGRVYEATVVEAAAAYGMNAEILMGIGITESGFYPRDSGDGGRGLFQITAPPRGAEAAVRERLAVDALDPLNQRHNAFVAAATLKEYLEQMHGDLFLALLAYNIGPRNGGLASIMKQYGARDFVTIQPYLQQLPRDYPVRVLSGALAYRLWRSEHKLLRYEDGDNAQTIQRIGIPGIDTAMVASEPPPAEVSAATTNEPARSEKPAQRRVAKKKR